MLVGPSGVGKTETALALAQELYGGESHLITINMSEYQEAHTVSSLKGSPPGYVGYGQGGVLTEAVRRNPYSVVLLDEIEKAHQDVQELFFQVFDKGTLEDGEGRVIDFKNTTILLTSNTGSSSIMQACLNHPVEQWPTAEQLLDKLKPSLYQQFKPAFLGRMQIVPYFPLHDDLLIQIIEHKLGKIIKRIEQQYHVQVQYSDDVSELLLSRCTEVDSGARNIDHILNASILPALATEILLALSEQKLPNQIWIDVDNDEFIYVLDSKIKQSKKKKAKAVKAETV
jgi:type VI secretion system protein VasG